MYKEIALMLAIGTMAWSGSALAYWTGATSADGVELKEGPGPAYRTVKVLPRGTSFNAVDTPRQGYYRIRTAQASGYIEAAAASRPGSTGGASSGFGGSDPSGSSGDVDSSSRRRHRRGDSDVDIVASEYRRFSITALGNFDFYAPSDLNAVLGSTVMNGGFSLNAMTFGGEFQYFIKPEWALALRVEMMGNNVLAKDNGATSDTFQLQLRSTPITPGVFYVFHRDKSLMAAVGGFVGLAPTTFTSDDQTVGVTQTLSSTAPTALILIEGSWEAVDHLSLVAEAGYRYLSTGALTPDNTTALHSLFLSTYTLNMSGAILGLGLRFAF